MDRTPLISRVARIVSWCAVATVLTTTLLLASPRLRWWVHGPAERPAYEQGTRIDLPARSYADADVTAFLFVRASCEICQENKALYAEVVRELRSIRSARVVAVLQAPLRGEDTAYAAELGLRESEYESIEFAGLKVRRVPTLAVVNRGGVVIDAWEGAPPLSQRTEFAATVRSAVQR